MLALEPEAVSAGPFALLIVGAMLVVTVLLIRNMSGRIKRLPREFPDDKRGVRRSSGDTGDTGTGPQDPTA